MALQLLTLNTLYYCSCTRIFFPAKIGQRQHVSPELFKGMRRILSSLTLTLGQLALQLLVLKKAKEKLQVFFVDSSVNNQLSF